MTKKREIAQEQFEKLLGWLNPDREFSGIKYESIRLRLIKFFTLRGFKTADELADITIDIVAEKIDSVVADYNGDPAHYFLGVAKKILLKYKNVPQPELPYHLADESRTEDENLTKQHVCLEKCLEKLKKEDRELITAYFRESKSEKISLRKDLADKRGISAQKLRVQVHRIKEILEKCVRQCLKNVK